MKNISRVECIEIKEEQNKIDDEAQDDQVFHTMSFDDIDCKEEEFFDEEIEECSDKKERKRKNNYSEKERLLLQELVMKNAVLVGSKRTDKCSNLQKAKAWDSIQEAFNSKTENDPRSVEQLKKLWDNLKFKRKLEITGSKRKLIRTGSGLLNPETFNEDSERDLYKELDIEIHDDVFSDAGIYGKYNSDGKESLILSEESQDINRSVNHQSTDVEITQMAEREETQTKKEREKETTQSKKNAREDVAKEASLRVKRVQLQLQYDREFHKLRVKEAEFRIKEVELKGRIAEEELQELLVSHDEEQGTDVEDDVRDTPFLYSSDKRLLKKRKQENSNHDSRTVLEKSHPDCSRSYEAFSRYVARKMEDLPSEIAIYAEKFINEILFEAQMGTLKRESKIILEPS